ncbi:tether containing UBX domain for GLUT4 isoform X2 [Chelonia mydas]|uniref:tether containing UBX domain for GLUT4 isoform X2 n=1 Tax=Chelonia mydas TaxID=8469 RepID=UPI001CA99702|nr:tether containing UBX domain for GLUT4 isoform X2 [Chelonia mydas]
MAAAAGGRGFAVSVLAPNGRRVTVRVGPGTTLLQVLEEACGRQNFDAGEYDLKFQRSVLDLSLQWRFARLPNNAKLEVVPITRNRAGTENRNLVPFGPTHPLCVSNILGPTQVQQHCMQLMSMVRLGQYLDWKPPKECSGAAEGSDCIAVEQWFPVTGHLSLWPDTVGTSQPFYTNQIAGKASLERTTLKSLGLTGGNAIIRVVMKKCGSPGQEEALDTAAPFSKLPVSPVFTEGAVDMPSPHTSMLSKDLDPRDVAFSLNNCTDKQDLIKESQASLGELWSPSDPAPAPFVPFFGDGQRLGGTPLAADFPVSDMLSSKLPTSLSSPGGPSKPKKSKTSQEQLKEQEQLLEREPVVCHPDLDEPLSAGPQDLPDEFFEVTVDDVRKRLAQLQSERKRLEEAPLMTKSLREAQMKEKLEHYPKVVLRVQFPDRHVLQGFFRPNETVGILRDFVRSHLADAELPFYLFIAPPRAILSNENETLFQANLFPASVIHFGSEERRDCYLRPELLESTVSLSTADLLVARGLSKSLVPCAPPASETAVPPPVGLEETDGKRTAENPEPAGASEASQPVRSPPEKVPKWLKLPAGKR